MKLMRLCLFTLLLAALSLTPLWAGVVYEIETTDHAQSPPKVESVQMEAEGRHLKMGIPSGAASGESDAIFKGGDDPQMIIIDHERRGYYVMDREQAAVIAGGISSAMTQMQEALKNLPEDKRAMAEQMMKQRLPQGQQQAPERPKSELKKTSERADHNGYPCVKYEVHQEGRKVRELWVTDWKNVEGSDDVAETFEEVGDFFRELMDSFGEMAQAGGGFGGNRNVDFFESLRELDGFPVVTKEFNEDGSLESEATLRSATRRTLDPADFEPPSGYKRQSMGGF